jgi:hypothetical protein
MNTKAAEIFGVRIYHGTALGNIRGGYSTRYYVQVMT